jgi:hypothetical protein
VAQLINKENAINDLVTNYKRGGTRLIHVFHKARQQDIDVFQSHIHAMERKIAALINREAAELKSSIDQMKRNQLADLQMKWEDQQQAMWVKLKAVLASSN